MFPCPAASDLLSPSSVKSEPLPDTQVSFRPAEEDVPSVLNAQGLNAAGTSNNSAIAVIQGDATHIQADLYLVAQSVDELCSSAARELLTLTEKLGDTSRELMLAKTEISVQKIELANKDLELLTQEAEIKKLKQERNTARTERNAAFAHWNKAVTDFNTSQNQLKEEESRAESYCTMLRNLRQEFQISQQSDYCPAPGNLLMAERTRSGNPSSGPLSGLVVPDLARNRPEHLLKNPLTHSREEKCLLDISIPPRVLGGVGGVNQQVLPEDFARAVVVHARANLALFIVSLWIHVLVRLRQELAGTFAADLGPVVGVLTSWVEEYIGYFLRTVDEAFCTRAALFSNLPTY
ncbi:hypothetical protein BDP27DRAFT_1448880 [Rhodocollybia butyracea]|uniref:Uncharacterized protein n=1 Tax=Rhodocollybia butyracea TaxID=206335 RepID=A0A9P5U6B7_9AGAR|nr:hypothetical protein BDP27DRAFT_1448880 [Rhodocollybia butyracea]